MDNFIGYIVSVECGDRLGTFQGHINCVDPNNQAITLSKVYQNGVPYPSPKLIINASDIVGINIIDKVQNGNEKNEFSSITVKKPVARRAGRSISESLFQSTPRKAEENRFPSISNEENKSSNKKDKQKQRWLERDEACFGTPVDSSIGKDFDFEKNLALFNKQAVFEEINASHRPDLVRQADKQVEKYRHDENVITSLPTVHRQIQVPEPDSVEYVTDDGLIIPTVSPGLRNQLFLTAERLGLGPERWMELMGRCATEMAIQLLGGGHRLNPHNAHQWPTVVALCGSHTQGAVCVNAARQLASHGVRTVVFLLDAVNMTSSLASEVTLYKQTRNKLIMSVQVSELPASCDLILMAAACHTAPSHPQNSSLPAGYQALARWTNEKRAPVLAIDPPKQGSPLVASKYCLVPALPLALQPSNGKVYLCNLSLPSEAFKQTGIKYRSPFGPKFVIPLHLNQS